MVSVVHSLISSDTARTTQARDQRKRGLGALFEEQQEQKEVIEVEP